MLMGFGPAFELDSAIVSVGVGTGNVCQILPHHTCNCTKEPASSSSAMLELLCMFKTRATKLSYMILTFLHVWRAIDSRRVYDEPFGHLVSTPIAIVWSEDRNSNLGLSRGLGLANGRGDATEEMHSWNVMGIVIGEFDLTNADNE